MARRAPERCERGGSCTVSTALVPSVVEYEALIGEKHAIDRLHVQITSLVFIIQISINRYQIWSLCTEQCYTDLYVNNCSLEVGHIKHIKINTE